MCEYCGCQTLPAIALLTAEHDATVNLIGEVRAAVEQTRLAEAADGCRRIRAVLGPPTRLTEEAPSPPIRAEVPDKIHALQAEHRTIEAVLTEASTGTPTDPLWPPRLLGALHELREHILKEQDGVFPASLAVLTPEDWDL